MILSDMQPNNHGGFDATFRRYPIIQWQKLHDLATFDLATDGSAGFDLSACIDDEVWIEPGRAVPIPSGVAVRIPRGWEGMVRSRSGLAFKHRVRSFIHGTIDSDYRGEITLLIENAGDKPYNIKPGDRVSQLVVNKCLTEFRQVEDIQHDETKRGHNGFGSTGR